MVEREVRGLSAVTFQHEVDHLNGTLFVDRVSDPATFATWEQFERFQRHEFAARAARLVARFGS
jgi:peptide deformylase